MATFYERRGRWRAQVRRAGVSRSAEFATKKAAVQWARSVEHEIDLGKFSSTTTTTLTTVLQKYRAELRKPLGTTKASVLRMLESGLGRLRVSQLTAAQIYEYVRRREREGAGPATISQDLMYLRLVTKVGCAFLGVDAAHALDAVATARAALAHAKRVGSSKERDRRPTTDELEKILGYLTTRPRSCVPAADMVHFARCTTLRLGEIVRLEWEDLDEKSRTVVVRARKDPQNPRTGRIPLLRGPVTWKGNVLDPLEIILRQRRISRRIFPYSSQTMTNWWIRACRELEIEDLHFHDLRHDAISMLFEAGYQIQEVAVLSGHRSWKHLQRYTHIRPETLHRDGERNT